MFTQCPACETIFKISAEVLRAAAGEVRCGRCGEIFNALRSLAEEPRAFTSAESPQEQEARADKILRAAEDLPAAILANDAEPHEASAADAEAELDLNLEEFASNGAPGTQIAQLEIQGATEFEDWEEEEPAAHTTTRTIADDPSMEFTLPPGELDRIFVEARPHHFVRGKHNLLLNAGVDEIEPVSPEHLSGDLAPADQPGETTGTAADAARSAVAETPAERRREDAAAGADPLELEELTAQALPAIDLSDAVPTPRPGPPALPPADTALDAVAEREVPDFLRAAPPAAAAQEPRRNDWIEQIIPTRDIEEFDPPRETHRGRWAAAAVLFAALLGVQLVHHNRDALAQSPSIGGAVRSLYQIAGYPIPLKMNLSAFEVRQWGVTGEANANGTLRVRASLINTGASAQPYPLLRLTLADRFGTRVGMRDFLPAEYLRQAPTRPLDPGERADTLVEIVDPGKTAEGFEIDVCERRLDARVVCANESPARPR